MKMKNLILLLTFGIISYAAVAQADSANHYYILASKQKNDQRYAEAEKLYAKSYKFDQKNFDVLYDWGQALLAQKRYRDAQDKLEKADRLNSKHEGVLEN